LPGLLWLYDYCHACFFTGVLPVVGLSGWVQS